MNLITNVQLHLPADLKTPSPEVKPIIQGTLLLSLLVHGFFVKNALSVFSGSVVGLNITLGSENQV